MRKKLFVGCFALIAISLLMFSSGCAEESKEGKKETKNDAKFYPTTKPSAKAGEKIYVSECSKCHGINGAGEGEEAARLHEKPKNFTDLEFMRRESPQEFYEAILEGKEDMPSYEKELNENQRWDALAYIWSLGTTQTQIDEGKIVYEKYCKSCHGEKGDGKGTAKSSIAKKVKDFTDPTFMTKENSNEFFSKVTEGDGPMPAFIQKLNEDQRWDVINYIWTFVYTPANK